MKLQYLSIFNEQLMIVVFYTSFIPFQYLVLFDLTWLFLDSATVRRYHSTSTKLVVREFYRNEHSRTFKGMISRLHEY